MNRSIDSPQNNDPGDRWSTNWCSEAKIPLFLQNSAPSVANDHRTRGVVQRMLKLTSNYEGLSVGPITKKPQTVIPKVITISQKKTLKFTVDSPPQGLTITRIFNDPTVSPQLSEQPTNENFLPPSAGFWCGNIKVFRKQFWVWDIEFSKEIISVFGGH